MINITCVFKKQKNDRGVEYSIEWVEKLYQGVRRNLDIPFKFTCLSNVTTPYNTIRLVSDSDIFWNKIELFRKNLFQGPTLYLDLDVVICKNITDVLLELPLDKFLMIREPVSNIINSSVMFWNGDYSYIFDNYILRRDLIINKYWTPGPRGYGDQVYLVDQTNPGLIDDYVRDNFFAWKHRVTGEHNVDNDPSMLVFHSKEKPSNNLTMHLVTKHWRNI